MLQPFIPIARQALSDPREAATTLMSMGVPRDALWPAFGLFVVLSAFLGSASQLISPAPQGLAMSPVLFAIVSGLAGAVSVFAIWRIGRAMEGTGSFQETLLLMVFLQGILFAGQLLELFLLLALPPLSGFFSIALVVFAFWLNINFVAALHGFTSLWRAFGCLLLASAGVALALIFLLTLFGVQQTGPV
ncbi:MAG: YIP1 family protein [Pseudomonadota bacterium]